LPDERWSLIHTKYLHILSFKANIFVTSISFFYVTSQVMFITASCSLSYRAASALCFFKKTVWQLYLKIVRICYVTLLQSSFKFRLFGFQLIDLSSFMQHSVISDFPEMLILIKYHLMHYSYSKELWEGSYDVIILFYNDCVVD